MSETIIVPVDDMRRGFTRYTKSEAVERGFQRYVTVAKFKRAIKRFETTDPWPFGRFMGAEPWSEPLEHSAWNRSRRSTSCGAEVTVEAGMSFPEPESEPLKKKSGLASTPGDVDPDSQHQQYD